MNATTRVARIPRSNPAAEPNASNLKARPNAAFNTSVRCAPRATRIPNSRSRLLTVRRHSKDARDRQHRAHHAQHTQRHRRHAGGKKSSVQHSVPGLDVEGQPWIQLAQFTPHGCGKLLDRGSSAPLDTSHWMAIAGWEKHRRLLIFSEVQISSVFYNPTTCTRVPIPHLVISAHCVCYGAKDFAGTRFTTATRGASLSSCHETILPANKDVPAAWKYSGDMLYIKAKAAAFDCLRSLVSFLKTFALLPPMPKMEGN